MKMLWKLLNLWIMVELGLYIGLFAIVVIALYVALGGPAKAPYAAAQAALARGDFREAGARYAAQAKNAPIFEREQILAATMHSLAGMPAAAEEALEANASRPIEAARWRARLRAQEGRLRDAADLLVAAALENPLEPTLLAEAAEALYAVGARDEALRLLDRPRVTWDPIPALTRAKFAILERRWSDAEREIVAAQAISEPGGPGAAEVDRLDGVLRLRAGDDSTAMRLFAASEAGRYRAAALLRAAILPAETLRIWEADRPELDAAWKARPALAPWSRRADRVTTARAAIAALVGGSAGAPTR